MASSCRGPTSPGPHIPWAQKMVRSLAPFTIGRLPAIVRTSHPNERRRWRKARGGFVRPPHGTGGHSRWPQDFRPWHDGSPAPNDGRCERHHSPETVLYSALSRRGGIPLTGVVLVVEDELQAP